MNDETSAALARMSEWQRRIIELEGGSATPAPWTWNAGALNGPSFEIADVDGFADTVIKTVNIADDAGGSATLFLSPYNDFNYGNVFGGLANATEAQVIAWVKDLYDRYELYGNTFLGHFVNIGNPTNPNGGICTISPVSNGEVWIQNMFPTGGLKLMAADGVAAESAGGDVTLKPGVPGAGGLPGYLILLNLPTSDPHRVGAAYLSSGAVKVSAG